MKYGFLSVIAFGSVLAVSAANAAVETYTGHGVVQSVNENTITIQQDAVTELGWPVRTMSYTVDGSTIAQGVKAGESVDFKFSADSVYHPEMHDIHVTQY